MLGGLLQCSGMEVVSSYEPGNGLLARLFSPTPIVIFFSFIDRGLGRTLAMVRTTLGPVLKGHS